MAITVGSQELVNRAMARVTTVSAAEAIAMHERGGALFIDLREPHEVAQGMVPGAICVPRGTLEFRIDPASPFFLESLTTQKPLVLYCQLASRSALAAGALMDMGFEDVAHIGGGFTAWRDAGGGCKTG